MDQVNICITGALGHIGSAFIRNLTIPNLGTVHLVNTLSKQRYASLMDLPRGTRYIFHEMDINSPEIEAVIKNCHVVVHLAGISDTQSSVDQQELVHTVNIKGLEHIVELCSKYNAALFFPSTTSVYSGKDSIFTENCSKKHIIPQSPYADSKLRGERLIEAYARTHALKYLIFRIGTIYGYSVGMRFDTAVNKFIYQAVRGAKISVWKTALDQRRPYCDLADCVRAINLFISKNYFYGDIYNIVTGNYSVYDIIEVIKKFIPVVSVELVDSRIMNMLSFGVSNSKSRKKGMKYIGTLEKSVLDTIKHFQNVNYTVRKT